MNTLEVLEIEDHHDHGLANVDAEYVPELRDDAAPRELKPLEITQPEGVSFTLEGNELKWSVSPNSRSS